MNTMKTEYQRVMKCVCMCILVCTALVSAAPLVSQEAGGADAAAVSAGGTDATAVITSVEVTGLKRTKPHIARFALEKFIGQDAAALDMNEVEAAIRDTGILEPVSVACIPAGDGVTLSAVVREKWSLFPLPLVMVSSGESVFGLMLVDTNAFGLNHQAAVGGIYMGGGWMATAMYHSTPPKKGLPGWNAMFMYADARRSEEDEWEHTLCEYDAVTLRGSLGLEYQFTDTLSASFTVSYTDVSVTKAIRAAPGDSRVFGFSPALSLRASRWDGFLLAEQRLSLSYGYYLDLEGASAHGIKALAAYNVPLVPGFLGRLQAALLLSPGGGGATVERTPQEADIDILPRKFSAPQYAAARAGLEKHLYGGLSVLVSWEAAFAYGGAAGNTFAHGPSGGLRLYLSRVALPALGVSYAYNMRTALSQFTFNLGMKF